MAKPSTRQGLIDYCLRQLGFQYWKSMLPMSK